MDKRPVIGVTGPDKRYPIAWWATRFSLTLLGAKAVHLTPSATKRPDRFDALVIGGGDDIDPELYGENKTEKAKLDPLRDVFEISMIRQGLRAGIPLLGICRGAQLLNVVLGGTLYTDIRKQRKHTSNRRTPLPLKTGKLVRYSRLQKIVQRPSCRINSLHHQAVRELGADLEVCARDLDGIVQGIESTNGQFILGVQWHPEYLPYLSAQRRIFSALIEAALHHRMQHSLI